MSLFNVNQTVASKARNTSTVPIKDKQFLIVTDSGDIFYDSDGTRVQLTDIIVLDTESQRLALTSPFEKFYFVKGSGALWRYNNSSWVKCSGGGSMSVDKVLSVASWSDNKQNIEISGLTADQNGIVGLSQSVSMEAFMFVGSRTVPLLSPLVETNLRVISRSRLFCSVKEG